MRSVKVAGDVKASLAAKPVKYTLPDYQIYLSISYDAQNDRPTMTFDGSDPEKLPPTKEDQLIY